MEVNSLYKLVRDFYGFKCSMIGMNSEKKEVSCTLYDSFRLICWLGERYGSFGAGIELGKESMISDFLGKYCSLNSDGQSIKESLQLIDDYCRLRLPDKFLEEYHKVHAHR